MKFVMAAPPPIYIHDPSMIDGAIRRCLAADLLGVDTETWGKGYTNMTDQVLVLGLCPDDATRYFVPRKYLDAFKPVLEADTPKALTNVKFDVHRLANAGITLTGAWADTQFLDYLLDEDTRENRHGLKDCMYDHFEIPMKEYKELFGKVNSRELAPGHALWDVWVDYASMDPWASRKLALYLMAKLDKIRKWEDEDTTLRDHYWDIEAPQLKTLYGMERRGIRIDVDYLTTLGHEFQAQMDDASVALMQRVGRPINIGSPKQLAQLFFEEMGLPVLKKNKTGPSVDESVINMLAAKGIEEAKIILKWREVANYRRTFCEGLIARLHTDGHIHTTYNPTLITGRTGSSDPNLQNIPVNDHNGKRIRGAFIADPNMVLVGGDYGQLEFRVAAFAANDWGLIEAIKNNRDLHCDTAAQIEGVAYDLFYEAYTAEKRAKIDGPYGQKRARSKAIGFGLLYGKTEHGLAADWGCSKAEARRFMRQFFQARPALASWIDDQIKFARDHGYVQTLAGRFRRLSKINSRRYGEKQHAERQAVNAPIQGSAADIVKKAMVMIDNDDYLKNELGFVLMLQVHDELVGQCPPEHAEEVKMIMQEYMEHPFLEGMPVPLEAVPKQVKTWMELK